jgi:hypothetical protein
MVYASMHAVWVYKIAGHYTSLGPSIGALAKVCHNKTMGHMEFFALTEGVQHKAHSPTTV